MNDSNPYPYVDAPPGPQIVATMTPAQRANVQIDLVKKEQARSSSSYDAAWSKVRKDYPDLFEDSQPKARVSNAQLNAELLRTCTVQRFVNEKTARGLDYDTAFRSVRHENPNLFAAMHQP